MRNLKLTIAFVIVITIALFGIEWMCSTPKNTINYTQYTNQLNKEGYYRAFFDIDYVDHMRINILEDNKEYYLVYTDYDTELIQEKVKTDSTTYFKIRECMMKDTMLYTFYMFENNGNFVIADSLYKIRLIDK